LNETPNLGLRRSGHMSRHNADCIADRLFYNRSTVSEEMIEKSYALALDRRCAINMLRYVLAIRKYDVRECLRQVPCAVSMIRGAHDRIAPVEDWEENLHLIARGSLHKLARCGHWPMIERPAEFNAILTKFMQEQV
jgi:pimeloyl-ACP methyl ester carboxylesterase